MVQLPFQNFVAFGNVYASGLSIIFIAIIIALIIRFVLHRHVIRLLKNTSIEYDNKLLDIIANPIALIISLIGLHVGLMTIFFQGVDATILNNVFSSIYLIVSVYVGARIILLTIKSLDAGSISRGRRLLSKRVMPFIERMVKFLGFLIAGLIILKIWGLDITPLLASAGIIGVAIAFAAKDSVANIFGGISIFLDKTYEVGDFIEIDQHTPRGEVVDIGLRSTKIKTRDDILIAIPNSLMSTSKVINQSSPKGKMRVRLPIAVVYGSDIKKVEKVAMGIAKKNKNALDDPTPRLRLRNLGDNGLEFELLYWIEEPSLLGITVHELNSEIYTEFNKAKIDFAFPHMELVGRKLSVRIRK